MGEMCKKIQEFSKNFAHTKRVNNSLNMAQIHKAKFSSCQYSDYLN